MTGGTSSLSDVVNFCFFLGPSDFFSFFRLLVLLFELCNVLSFLMTWNSLCVSALRLIFGALNIVLFKSEFKCSFQFTICHGMSCDLAARGLGHCGDHFIEGCKFSGT